MNTLELNKLIKITLHLLTLYSHNVRKYCFLYPRNTVNGSIRHWAFIIHQSKHSVNILYIQRWWNWPITWQLKMCLLRTAPLTPSWIAHYCKMHDNKCYENRVHWWCSVDGVKRYTSAAPCNAPSGFGCQKRLGVKFVVRVNPSRKDQQVRLLYSAATSATARRATHMALRRLARIDTDPVQTNAETRVARPSGTDRRSPPVTWRSGDRQGLA